MKKLAMKNLKKTGGFTLIEILVVIGIIAVLAAIVIVAINPAKQFAQARNTQRTSNVQSILNAVGQRMADNRGVFAGTFTIGTQYYCPTLVTGPTTILTSTDATPAAGELGCLVPTYISSLPLDPATGTGTDTGYTIAVDGVGRITVCAPAAASETSLPSPAPICITR
ncbi:MAG: type II secretion system protein [Minisyncoccia bacterium]